MTQMMTDRRESPRYSVTLAAQVTETLTSGALDGRLSDISRSGCYIDTLTPLAQGTEVNVRLRKGNELFETLAKVVYGTAGLGMGLHWGSNPRSNHVAVLNHWLSCL
jgi:hypothetical protein